MMNDTPNPRKLIMEQSEIDLIFTTTNSRFAIMRLDAECEDDTCEGDDGCDAPMHFQVTIWDAPELEHDPDHYLFCIAHAAESLGQYMINTLLQK